MQSVNRPCETLTLPLLRPMREEILLSLLSFSSFLWCERSFSALSSLPLFSLFSLSECRLRRELDPLSNDDRPAPSDFLWLELDACCETGVTTSLVGDGPLGGRKKPCCCCEA